MRELTLYDFLFRDGITKVRKLDRFFTMRLIISRQKESTEYSI